MEPTKLPLSVAKGYALEQTLQLINNYANMTATDLSSCEFQSYVVQNGASSIPIHVERSAALDLEGKIVLHLSQEVSATLEAGKHTWYLIWKDAPTAPPKILIEGVFTVKAGVPLWA